MKIALVGNCQIESIASCLNVLLPQAELSLCHVWKLRDKFGSTEALSSHLRQFDIIMAHRFYEIEHISFEPLRDLPNFIEFPVINFSAFHPDCVYIVDGKTRRIVQSIIGDYNSALVAFSFVNKFTLEQCYSSFRQSVFDYLGYFSHWDAAGDALSMELQRCGFNLSDYLAPWMSKKPFVYSINHPRLFAVHDIVVDALTRLDVPINRVMDINEHVADPLLKNAGWPIYNELACYFGVAGSYLFKRETPQDGSQYIYSLEEFIALSYRAYSAANVETIDAKFVETWETLNVADFILQG